MAAKTIVFGYEPFAINLFAYGNSGTETTAGNPEISIIAFLNKKVFSHLIPDSPDDVQAPMSAFALLMPA